MLHIFGLLLLRVYFYLKSLSRYKYSAVPSRPLPFKVRLTLRARRGPFSLGVQAASPGSSRRSPRGGGQRQKQGKGTASQPAGFEAGHRKGGARPPSLVGQVFNAHSETCKRRRARGSFFEFDSRPDRCERTLRGQRTRTWPRRLTAGSGAAPVRLRCGRVRRGRRALQGPATAGAAPSAPALPPPWPVPPGMLSRCGQALTSGR